MKTFTQDDIQTFGNYSRIFADVKDLVESPLAWQKLGLQQTASGYGMKLTSRYKINFNGKLRRLYVTQISNAGSLWFMLNGNRVCVS